MENSRIWNIFIIKWNQFNIIYKQRKWNKKKKKKEEECKNWKISMDQPNIFTNTTLLYSFYVTHQKQNKLYILHIYINKWLHFTLYSREKNEAKNTQFKKKKRRIHFTKTDPPRTKFIVLQKNVFPRGWFTSGDLDAGNRIFFMTATFTKRKRKQKKKCYLCNTILYYSIW